MSEAESKPQLLVVDYATGVKGSYCIGRLCGGTMSYWNPGNNWAGSGHVFTDRILAEDFMSMIQLKDLEDSTPESKSQFGPQVAELIRRVKYLLEWMPVCSIGSSGYTRRRLVEDAIIEMAAPEVPARCPKCNHPNKYKTPRGEFVGCHNCGCRDVWHITVWHLTPSEVPAQPEQDVHADTLFGVYCEGNGEQGLKELGPINWLAWQRVANFVNCKAAARVQEAPKQLQEDLEDDFRWLKEISYALDRDRTQPDDLESMLREISILKAKAKREGRSELALAQLREALTTAGKLIAEAHEAFCDMMMAEKAKPSGWMIRAEKWAALSGAPSTPTKKSPFQPACRHGVPLTVTCQDCMLATDLPESSTPTTGTSEQG